MNSKLSRFSTIPDPDPDPDRELNSHVSSDTAIRQRSVRPSSAQRSSALGGRQPLAVVSAAFVLLFLCISTVMAQERLAIHFDKSFYVSGEVIWYKVYLPASFRDQQLALKMGLWQKDGQTIGDHFLKTEGKLTVDGYVKVPYDITSGVYHFLVLGTKKDSKKPVKLAEAFIPIYNDLLEDWTNIQVAPKQDRTGLSTGNLQVAIQLPDNGPFQKREEIRARIRVTDSTGRPLAGNLSISVTDAALIEDGSQMLIMPEIEEAMATQLDEQMYINGIRHSFTPDPGKPTFFGLYAADENRCFFAETEADGSFALALPDFLGNKRIQFVDLQKGQSEFDVADNIVLSPTPPLVFTDDVKAYLEWSRNRKMIYQLYQTVETSLETESWTIEKQSLVPDQRIVIKDYTVFDDLFTFFTEVSTPLKIKRTKDSTYYAQMFNPDPRMRAFYQGDPIFVVDGTITRDVDFLQQLDLQKIDTIDLFFKINQLNQKFGKIGYSGVVVMQTSLPLLSFPAADSDNIFSISGLLPESEPSKSEDESAQQPIFRPQVCWMPKLSTAIDGTLEISFSQSDDLGTFRIEVMAQGPDGARGLGQIEYTVQW